MTRRPAHDQLIGCLLKASLELPEDTLVIAYFLNTNGLLHIWRLDRQTASLESRNVSHQIMEDITSSQSRPPTQSALVRLHQVLIEGVIEKPSVHKKLLVLADQHLARIPFAALRPTAASPPLMTHMVIAKIPRLFRLEDLRPPVLEAPYRLVSVGVAKRPTAPFEDLHPLPGVYNEMRQIGELYPWNRAFLDGDATFAKLQKALSTAQVFHFAGHSSADRQDPLLSYLLLPTGVVSGQALGTLDLSHLRVAVLSACNTRGAVGNGLEPLGVPLLEAGAGAVIGNLWPVDDQLALKLSLPLHRALRTGLEPAAALQRAQVQAWEGTGGQGDVVWMGWETLEQPPLQLKTAGAIEWPSPRPIR